MPITIPPSTSFQGPLIPVASRWAKPPPEGPKFIPAEIDWGITTPAGQAVQFSLNAGPLEFSQINAFSVDNSRCGADVSFVFPDTGRQLTVPALASGVFPVFTNSLTFYVLASAANVGDVTEFEILNTTPPPVSVLPSQEQSHAGVTGLALNTNGTTAVIPAGVTGTLQSFTLVTSGSSTTAGGCNFQLIDGTGTLVWTQTITVPAGYNSQTIPVTGIRVRFVNGLNAVIASSAGITSGNVAVNAYYSVP